MLFLYKTYNIKIHTTIKRKSEKKLITEEQIEKLSHKVPKPND